MDDDDGDILFCVFVCFRVGNRHSSCSRACKPSNNNCNRSDRLFLDCLSLLPADSMNRQF